ncbi:DUF6931 family protein [Tundrisphaera sp. TA3]|uniref:DUF6931 family protein n=1 Tax=Tundrisphaera sp. TA3 TaxID=3435775 RepID=UPI003EB8B806
MDLHRRRPGDPLPPASPPPPARPAPPAARAVPAAAPETAADIARRYRPSDAAWGHLRGDLAPDAFAALLVDAGLGADAAEFQAHRLPAREAVWWGCLCAWEVGPPTPAGAPDEALRAAVRWVIEPTVPNRTAAAKAGEAAGPSTPEGLLALAASWSGGSMTPPELPAAAPPPGLTARTVFAALRMASARDPFGGMLRFAGIAAGVAAGSLRWNR